jgi:hypothetical protein
MTVRILVVDHESDVAELFQPRFRREVGQVTLSHAFCQLSRRG